MMRVWKTEPTILIDCKLSRLIRSEVTFFGADAPQP
jgi:hypothetical protein